MRIRTKAPIEIFNVRVGDIIETSSGYWLITEELDRFRLVNLNNNYILPTIFITLPETVQSGKVNASKIMRVIKHDDISLIENHLLEENKPKQGMVAVDAYRNSSGQLQTERLAVEEPVAEPTKIAIPIKENVTAVYDGPVEEDPYYDEDTLEERNVRKRKSIQKTLYGTII